MTSTKKKEEGTLYGLCVAFVPESTLLVVGTKEGVLLLMDYGSGSVVDRNDVAHEGAIWSLDVRKQWDEEDGDAFVVVTGGEDKAVKVWEVEEGDDSDESGSEEDEGRDGPGLVHVQTLQMSDDVVSVRLR